MSLFCELSAILEPMTTYAANRKAGFNYELLETFEAGLSLFGHEVKSARNGKAKLDGSYVIVRGGEAYLVNASFAPYQPANTPNEYDPLRPRKLLLSKKELARLDSASEREGLTIIPLRLYNNNRKLKLEVAIARGKKKYDKRESIKRRDTKRDIERTLKNQ